VIGGPRFYERMEIRDAMAYFRVAVSPENDLAFERIVNTPKRGLGDKAQQNIQMAARRNGVSLVDGARILLDEGGIKGKGAGELKKLLDAIERWHQVVNPARRLDPGADAPRDLLGDPVVTEDPADDSVLEDIGAAPMPEPVVHSYDHVELAQVILDESGYTEMWQNDKTPEAPGRLENLKELVKALDQFENLQGFLEHVSLIMDNETDQGDDKVSIMTLHAAKGLEFPAVFLPGWEDGLFPSQRSMDESGLKGLEEERRLAYVGLTRAEELATVSFASNRFVFGQWQSAIPSRFIDEIPQDTVEVLTPPGLHGATQAAPQSNLADRVAKADVYNSPGWKRLQMRQQSHGLSQPRESRNVVIDATAVSAFTVGERVFHQKFGYGIVTAIEGDKLGVAFEKAGEKKVVASFVTAAEKADDVPF